MEQFAPDELAEVFRALQEAGWDAVLVGGQAVNIWACHFERDVPAWRQLRPYTSRDLDYHGGLAEARLAMRVLHAQGQLNTGSDPGPNAGALKVSLADGPVGGGLTALDGHVGLAHGGSSGQVVIGDGVGDSQCRRRDVDDTISSRTGQMTIGTPGLFERGRLETFRMAVEECVDAELIEAWQDLA